MHTTAKRIFCVFWMAAATALLIFSAIKLGQHQEPFYTWFYCFAWWSCIVFVEAWLCYHPRGTSLLFTDPGEFLLRLPLSITIWLIFELFNFRLHNWHYVQLPPETAIRWCGYAVSFATVLPAIFAAWRLLQSLGLFQNSHCHPLAEPAKVYRYSIALGLSCLILPLLWPRYFFPLVWLAFIFLLEPFNHRAGAPSLLEDWQQGVPGRLYNLLAAGLGCGLLWELLNFWAGSKWVYTIPFVGWPKLFEMPVLGFLGFAPFAVECYVMMNTFRVLRKRLKRNYPPERRARLWMQIVVAATLFDLLLFWGIDHYSVLSFIK